MFRVNYVLNFLCQPKYAFTRDVFVLKENQIKYE